MDETLAELLRAWRDLHEYSQEEAAARCGITRSSWGMLETGRRSRVWDETLKALAAGMASDGIDEDRIRRAATRSQILKLQGNLQPPASATPPKEPALAH